MKKILILTTALVIAASGLQAQKIYSTKSGKITFFSKAPLEDIEAKNSEVESKLAPSNGQLVFTLLVKGFHFPNALMEEHFNENYMESTKFPKSDFKGYVTNIQEINFQKDGSYPAKVKGKLTIHGITREVETTGTIDVKGDKVSGKSKFNINLKDYGIGGALVGKKIAENISITVDSQYE
jgi:polyisoprenoid-binding protein YceI